MVTDSAEEASAATWRYGATWKHRRATDSGLSRGGETLWGGCHQEAHGGGRTSLSCGASSDSMTYASPECMVSDHVRCFPALARSPVASRRCSTWSPGHTAPLVRSPLASSTLLSVGSSRKSAGFAPHFTLTK